MATSMSFQQLADSQSVPPLSVSESETLRRFREAACTRRGTQRRMMISSFALTTILLYMGPTLFEFFLLRHDRGAIATVLIGGLAACIFLALGGFLRLAVGLYAFGTIFTLGLLSRHLATPRQLILLTDIVPAIIAGLLVSGIADRLLQHDAARRFTLRRSDVQRTGY